MLSDARTKPVLEDRKSHLGAVAATYAKTFVRSATRDATLTRLFLAT